jgi:hypothetical protein
MHHRLDPLTVRLPFVRVKVVSIRHSLSASGH